jgi:molybdate transport system substrate-binding protein
MFRAFITLLLLASPLRAEIVVSAAASLGDVLTEAAAAWKTETGETVRLNLGASHALAMQIAAGAPADLFISATGVDADALETRGLIAGSSRRALASNVLVVIVPSASTRRPRSARDLASPTIRLALGDLESSPAGIHAKRYLTAAGVWPALEARVIPAADVRAALAMVASGAADAGIVYRTDALSSRDVRIAFVPEAPPIAYTAALVRRRAANRGASAFLDFLASPAGREMFRKHGFSTR